MADIIPILQANTALIKTIREIVSDSSNVFLGPALDKGIAGDVAMSQIWKCLEEGNMQYQSVQNEYGDYLCDLNHVTAGQDIYLTVAVNIRDPLNKKIYVLHISEG